MKLCPVILAGGEGTRLWPLSRKNYPKQFLRLFGDYSLLQNTLLRGRGLQQQLDMAQPLVICNEEYRFIVQEHAYDIGEQLQAIILDPAGRNTAPALTIAALVQQEDAVLLMMPADHVIKQHKIFEQNVITGMQLAEAGQIVTFGMQPTGADSGYGYIRKGNAEQNAGSNVFLIQQFVEKPDEATMSIE